MKIQVLLPLSWLSLPSFETCWSLFCWWAMRKDGRYCRRSQPFLRRLVTHQTGTYICLEHFWLKVLFTEDLVLIELERAKFPSSPYIVEPLCDPLFLWFVLVWVTFESFRARNDKETNLVDASHVVAIYSLATRHLGKYHHCYRPDDITFLYSIVGSFLTTNTF